MSSQKERGFMEWLPLNEYANTHGISISTLRRRIKTGRLAFNSKMENITFLLRLLRGQRGQKGQKE